MITDEFGKDITYYIENGSRSYFKDLAERIKKFGFSDFNPPGITSYLTFRYPIGDLTMFETYKKIPCGAELKNGKIQYYWYPKFKNEDITFEEAFKKVEDLLIKSIADITSDKKIAIPLSGGIDSSLVLAICRKLYPDKKIYTYSAGFYGDDEFEYSRLVAKKNNSIHKEKVLYREDFIGENSLLRPLIGQKCAPLHPNEIALANIEKMAKSDGCDIAVCGEGADDIFGGYGQNLRMYMNYKNDTPFFKFFLDNYRYFSLEDRRKIIKDKYLVDDFQLLNSFLDEREMPEDIRDKVFYFIQKVHTPGLIIRGVNAMRFNNMGMGFPYTNIELVNFVNSLPFEFKLRWKSEKHKDASKEMYFRDISEKMDIPKYILKKLAEKYLPHEVIYRPKHAFPVPFDEWFRNLDKWNLDDNVFKTKNISNFNGWKKFMIINLNTFIDVFRNYKHES